MSVIYRKLVQPMEKEIQNNDVFLTEEKRLEREKSLQIIRGYRPIDDDFMRELFRDENDNSELAKLMHDFRCSF